MLGYRSIIFDADGVLIQSKHLFSETLQREYGISLKTTEPFFFGVFRDCGLGKADLKEELAKVLPHWGWPGTVDDLVAFWLTRGTEIDKSALGLVRSLRERGLPTYLVTDQEKYRGEHLRKVLEGDVFDHVFFSAEFGCTKKDPTFWEKVYSAMQLESMTREFPLQKSSCLYIDDEAKNFTAARHFGFSTYHYDGNLDALRRFLFSA